jgi:acetyltransferase-like isoleucine patch superfamily enzyme
MIRDHRPYYIKRLIHLFEVWYANHFVAPHFAALGPDFMMLKPWYVDVHGAHIEAGANLHLVTASDRRISFCTWQFGDHQGHINLGDHVLICPGVRIDSASEVSIGDNTMLAAGCYVSDADWHDLIDRTQPIGITRPVTIGQNVWLGDGVTVCKGVQIGDNTIVGARSVVTGDLPANVIAAGNPARVIRDIPEPDRLITRATLFQDPALLAQKNADIDRYFLSNNSTLHWLRTLIAPKRGD